MPYKDGSGPAGRGPMTGRGMGPCSGGAGQGMGRGMGRGRFGPSCWAAPSLTKEEEAEMLKKQKAAIEARLKELD